MKLRHEVCGEEFWLPPSKLWSCGRGCPKCRLEARNKMLSAEGKKRFEDALAKSSLEVIQDDFEYKNNKTSVLVRCRKCGREQKMTTGNIVRGHGCKSCARRIPTEEKEAQFVKKLAQKAPEWELTGKYQGANVRAMFRHSPCGAEYMKTPEIVLMYPERCQFCNAKKLRSSPEDYAKSVAHKVDYELLTDYVDWNTKILIRHKKCGHQFLALPGVFRRSDEGCPFCKNNLIASRVVSTHEEFIKRLGARAEDYEFITKYKKAKLPILARHKSCGTEFEITPDSMLRGGRCKTCNNSTGEVEVLKFVQSILPGEKVVHGDRTHLPYNRELDVWVPGRKIAIEYDGLKYHTREHFMSDPNRNWTAAQASKYHLWKTEKCEKQGIWLIHIFEDEWLEHRDIVEDKLKAVFKCPMERYYARKLELRPVKRAERDKFLEANHIQGKASGGVAIGLYDGEALLAVQVFLSKGRGSWELVRYATKLGTSVVGGFTKCLRWFERNYSPKKIKTFGDKRWCSPYTDVYKRTGFTLDGETDISYWYVKGVKRWHKAKFRKAKLKKMGVDVRGKTEDVLMQELGYERIYDCGRFRYIKEY